MQRPSINSVRSLLGEPAWAGYVFAIASSGLAAVLEWGFYPTLGTQLSLHLLSFAAVISTATLAGLGPGLAATGLVTLWSVIFLQLVLRLPASGATVPLVLYFIESLVLCAVGARLRRSTFEAARSEDWHRRLVDTSGEGIWISESDGTISYANAKMAEILGCDIDQIVNRNREEFLFPADIAIERIRYRAFLSGNREQIDRRIRRKDGSEAWVLACSSPVFNDKGEFLSVLAMMTDITERKRAESALRRSEQRYRGLFENILEGVYQSTPDGRILAANPMLLRMLGLSSEADLNDVNIAQHLYVDPDVRRDLLELLERDGSFQNVEYQLRRRDRHIITVRENARVVRDEDGNVLYYEGTLADITEKIHIEEQLRQAQKMEALGRLAAGIAQDFRTIVSNIDGHTKLLAEELPVGHPAHEHAEAAARAASGAVGLTQQILAFSKRHSAATVTIDLNRVIRAHENTIRRLCGADLALNLSPHPIAVVADEDHIAQIVSTLVMCARESVDSGTVKIASGITQVDEAMCCNIPSIKPADFAMVSVSVRVQRETGFRKEVETPGVPAVSTTQAMVAQYGGFVATASEPGRSAAFQVYLPLADMLQIDSLNETPRHAGNARTSVLFVESDPLVRELTRDMLERQGFRVLTAGDASEARRTARQEEFEVLVAGLEVPIAGGLELARQLKAGRRGLCVVLVSGYGEPEIDRAEMEDLQPGFLQKPFSADALARKIRQMLERNAVRRV